jgi:hypothetical protein
MVRTGDRPRASDARLVRPIAGAARLARETKETTAMPSYRDVGPPYHRVIAEFEKSSLAFSLPLKATLADLAVVVGTLGQPRGGMPLSVAVTIGA